MSLPFYIFMAILVLFSGWNIYNEAQRKAWARVTASIFVMLAAILITFFKILTSPMP